MIKQVNPHFKEFLFDWNQKFQFLVGGYGSSKSYHVALKIVLKLLKEKRTALVIRGVRHTQGYFTYVRQEAVANEGLSITENLAQIGVKIPTTITDRLQTIENEKEQSKNNADKAAG